MESDNKRSHHNRFLHIAPISTLEPASKKRKVEDTLPKFYWAFSKILASELSRSLNLSALAQVIVICFLPKTRLIFLRFLKNLLN